MALWLMEIRLSFFNWQKLVKRYYSVKNEQAETKQDEVALKQNVVQLALNIHCLL